jgi:L-alanine-DL-glutamate epimerase-like enolase superfamily enzyme
MKITAVQSFLLSYPFSQPLRLSYYGGEREIVKRDALFIRVQTDKGLVGYAPGQAAEKAHRAITETIGPFLTGRALGDPDALRIQFLQGPGRDLDLAKAYCSVEIALYDILGKSHGVPVSELLGGRVRDRIRLYGSAGMYMPPEGYAEEAARVAELGFRAYKMRPALGPEKDVETVRRMREAVGDSFELMVDAHSWWRMGDQSYGQETVEQVARDLSEFDITWLEEPLPPDDHAAYRRLKDLSIVPLAAGEHEPDEERFLDLIQSDAVDYVQMDIVCQGGYPLARRLFNEISHAGNRFAFHSWGTALEIIAAAQVGICWPEMVVEWLEYPCYSTARDKFMYEFPLASDILREPLEINGGGLVVSHKPGLGVEVDETVIERYPWIPGPWSFFTMHSPRQTWAVTGDHSIQWAGSRS